MIVRAYMRTEFLGGGEIFVVETTFDEVFIDNPRLKAQQAEILGALKGGNKFLLGDDLYLIAKDFDKNAKQN